ncbi:MAG: NAD(P)-dependent oxidoreductase [Synergistaceae bacterium]
MKKAIVTGANGFVGIWLLKTLLANAIEVIAVVKDRDENVDDIKKMHGVEIVYCELADLSSLKAKLKKLGGKIDAFYHLAWCGSTGDSRGDYELQLNNAKYTVDAVKIAFELGCKRFVGAGTLAEFDCNAYLPINGSTPSIVSNYGVAKIAAHYMSKAEANRLGIDHVWAYLSNTYGIGNRTQNFINFAVKKMLVDDEVNFTTATQLYDFVYVSDIASALYLLAEKGRNNYAYYIGSTQPTELKNYITMIRDAIDNSIVLNFGAVEFKGIKHPKEVFDCAELVEQTGYCPKVSFEDGIRDTIKWLSTEISEGRI